MGQNVKLTDPLVDLSEFLRVKSVHFLSERSVGHLGAVFRNLLVPGTGDVHLAETATTVQLYKQDALTTANLARPAANLARTGTSLQ